MATRDIITIDESKCDGCGLCVSACAEGAIQIVEGKAKLISQSYCDGLGACLGTCPQDAITIERAEAPPFDEEAVRQHLHRLRGAPVSVPEQSPGPAAGCPGTRAMSFRRPASPARTPIGGPSGPLPSQLGQWPIQLHLVAPTADAFRGADLLLAADCVAFAVGDFHQAHLKGKALAVCCPKLDGHQERYVEKLIAMIDGAQIRTLTVMIMEVPCCHGLLRLAQRAWSQSKRRVPVEQVVVGVEGDILSSTWVSESWSGAGASTHGDSRSPELHVIGNR